MYKNGLFSTVCGGEKLEVSSALAIEFEVLILKLYLPEPFFSREVK